MNDFGVTCTQCSPQALSVSGSRFDSVESFISSFFPLLYFFSLSLSARLYILSKLIKFNNDPYIWKIKLANPCPVSIQFNPGSKGTSMMHVTNYVQTQGRLLAHFVKFSASSSSGITCPIYYTCMYSAKILFMIHG